MQKLRKRPGVRLPGRLAGLLSVIAVTAGILFGAPSCRTMRRTVAVLVTPTPGPREPAAVAPPRAPAVSPQATAPATAAPVTAPSVSRTATPMPVATAPPSIYQETPGVIYEKPDVSPAPITARPGRGTPTRKPGVYYEDETPTPTRTPR